MFIAFQLLFANVASFKFLFQTRVVQTPSCSPPKWRYQAWEMRKYDFETYMQAFSDLGVLTFDEVQSYVESKGSIVPLVISVGATEQHGPTGLIGTDYITASAVARRVCELENVLLGPQLQVGMSLHHCCFSGSCSLRPSTFVNMICDIIWTLHASSHFTHFFIINGHGGNTLPLMFAKAILTSGSTPSWLNLTESNLIVPSSQSFSPSSSDIKVEVVAWYANNKSQTLARQLYADELGQHATPDEVAITKYLLPDVYSSKQGMLDPTALTHAAKGSMTARLQESENVALTVETLLKELNVMSKNGTETQGLLSLGKMALTYMDPMDFKRRFPDGRMWSNPALSTAEHGELLLHAAVESVRESLRAFISQ